MDGFRVSYLTMVAGRTQMGGNLSSEWSKKSGSRLPKLNLFSFSAYVRIVRMRRRIPPGAGTSCGGAAFEGDASSRSAGLRPPQVSPFHPPNGRRKAHPESLGPVLTHFDISGSENKKTTTQTAPPPSIKQVDEGLQIYKFSSSRERLTL